MIKILVAIAALAKLALAECLQGCRICSSNNDCLFCDYELSYALVGTNCKLFNLPNCALMDPVGVCLSCKPDYYLDPFTTSCIALNKTGLPENCISFSSQTDCTMCKPGFYVLNGACSAVPTSIPNCLVANSTDPARCQQCVPGKVTDHDQMACLNVTSVQNCVGYSVFKCNSCADGFLLDMNMNLSSPLLSVAPARRFYIQQQFLNDKLLNLDQGVYSTCNPILISNCQLYINTFTCAVCQPGYYLLSGLCVAFPKPIILNCDMYLDDKNCLNCKNGFYLVGPMNCTAAPVSNLCKTYNSSASTPVCIACQDAYFLNSDGICQSRSVSQNILNCVQMSNNADTCAACKAGFQVTDDFLSCLPLVQNCAVYVPSTSSTVQLVCQKCMSGFYFQNSLCNTIQITNCLFANVVSGVVTCLTCNNKFYVSNGLCVAQPVIGNCSVYSQTSYNTCAQCNQNYFLFVPANICQQSVYLQSCIVYQSSTACAQCKDGFYVLNGICVPITSIANCLQIANARCTKCQSGYMITSESSTCVLPDLYFSQNCQVNNADGTVLDTDLTCTYCSTGNIPVSYLDNSVCTNNTYIPSGFLVANCIRYNYVRSTTLGVSGTYSCVLCASGFILDPTTNTCVTSCASITAAPLILGMEVAINKNLPTDTTFGNFQVQRLRICANPTPPFTNAYTGCKSIFPELFAQPSDGSSVTYYCGQCLTGYVGVIRPATTIYFNTSLLNSTTSTNLMSLSPVQTFPSLFCVLSDSTFMRSLGINSNTAFVTDCEYYYAYKPTSPGNTNQNSYGCYKCKAGSAGALRLVDYTSASGPYSSTSQYTNTAVIDSCSASITDCNSDHSWEIYTASEDLMTTIKFNLGLLYTCKLCNNNKIPYLAINMYNISPDGMPRHSNWYWPGNQYSTYMQAASLYQDSTSSYSAVNCYLSDGNAMYLRATPYAFVANCGLGIINTGSYPVNSDATISSPGQHRAGIYCFACTAGYRPLRITSNVANAPLMVYQCIQIENCDSSTWFNACSKCKNGFTWPWNPATSTVDYSTCVANPIANCHAIDNTGSPSVCRICEQKYTINLDGQCELFRAPNCDSDYFVFNRNFNITTANTQLSVGLFMMSLGTGCPNCPTGFSGWVINDANANTYCTFSKYMNDQTWASSATTAFIARCVNYGYDRTLKKMVCMVCSSGFIRTTTGGCVSQLPNCLVASVGIATVCAQCMTGYINVNGVCQTKNIPNCDIYADSSRASSQTCLTCSDGYYPQGASCVQGNVENCIRYSSRDVCSKCKASYAVVNALNSKTYCYPIPAAQNCMAASSNFGSGSLECVNCSEGYAISTTLSLIPPSVCLLIVPIANCGSYNLGNTLSTSLFTCRNCTDGYWLAPNNTCVARKIVFRQCAEYNIVADLCARCISGQYLSPTNTSCIPFPTGFLGCINYTSALNCTQCDKGLFFNGTFCNAVPSNQTVDNCDYYKDSKTCIQCANNYALISGKCIGSSATGCLTWTSTTACGSCYAGYGFQTTSGIRSCVAITDQQCLTYAPFFPFSCSLCRPGYYPLNGVCTAVTVTIQFCIVYDSPSTCVQCDQTSVLNPARTQCLKSMAYFNYFDQNCNFMTILSSPVCNKCGPNYYFVNGTCTLCPNATMNQGCYYCNPVNTSNCMACKSGHYQKIDGSCISNSYVPPTNTTPNKTNNTTTAPNNTTSFTPTNGTASLIRPAVFALVISIWLT